MTVAPYGSWASLLTAEVVNRDSVALTDLQLDGDDVYWVEMRPDEGGRQVVVRQRQGSTPEDVVPAGFNARTRVHEYGGGSYAVRDGVVWFSNFTDQRLWRVADGEDPVPITAEGPFRYADGRVTPDGQWIVCVRETHREGGGPADVVNELVAVPTGSDQGPVVLRAGRDFYSSPRLSSDGAQLAWVEWDFPNMPWDDTQLFVGSFSPQGLTDVRQVAGESGESVQQPRWSPAGDLHYITDRSGWWNVWRAGDGPLHDDAFDVGLPMWVFGMASYAFLDDGRIAMTHLAGARPQLRLLDPHTGVATAVTSERQPSLHVCASGQWLLFIGASPTEPPAVVEVSAGDQAETVLRRSSQLHIDPSLVARAEPITAPVGDGEVTHALFYPPTNPDFRGPDDDRPPLLVFTHGGPTAHVIGDLNAELQFWTSRGFAVVDVNYRGSTGYGREYRKSLDGRWGNTDVEDVVALVGLLAGDGRVDAARVAIRGGSAGGYTTLRALTTVTTFAAGASYFGVADVRALAEDTHKFESRYMERLMPPSEYDARSPINAVDALSTPLLVLQGLEDEIVPPAQAEAMCAALDAKKIPHAYLPFEGEQHGFRKAANRIRSLEAELSFYGQIFGFSPAGDVPPLDIKHLGAP